MEPLTPDAIEPLILSDAQVASLDDYLPGGSEVADDGGHALQQSIASRLSLLEQRLSKQSREMMPTDEFRQHVAARQAVQAATLAMQLQQAGSKPA